MEEKRVYRVYEIQEILGIGQNTAYQGCLHVLRMSQRIRLLYLPETEPDHERQKKPSGQDRRVLDRRPGK